MSYNLHYNRNIPCLIGRFVGNLDLETIKKYTKEMVKAASKCKCKSFLHDIKKTIWNLSVITLYNILEIFNQAGIDQSWTGAIVVSPKDFNHYQFIETIAMNRGINVKVFKNQNKATSWLKKYS